MAVEFDDGFITLQPNRTLLLEEEAATFSAPCVAAHLPEFNVPATANLEGVAPESDTTFALQGGAAAVQTQGGVASVQTPVKGGHVVSVQHVIHEGAAAVQTAVQTQAGVAAVQDVIKGGASAVEQALQTVAQDGTAALAGWQYADTLTSSPHMKTSVPPNSSLDAPAHIDLDTAAPALQSNSNTSSNHTELPVLVEREGSSTMRTSSATETGGTEYVPHKD